MSAQAARKPAGLLSIGQVLAKLGPEFPDLSPSKLRFLEDQGLISPQRTPSGYRKFDAADLERLRYILTLQRDHYLPLKVILGHLDDIDHGRTPQIPGANVRVEAPSILTAERRLSRAELQAEAGETDRVVWSEGALDLRARLIDLLDRPEGRLPHDTNLHVRYAEVDGPVGMEQALAVLAKSEFSLSAAPN